MTDTRRNVLLPAIDEALGVLVDLSAVWPSLPAGILLRAREACDRLAAARDYVGEYACPDCKQRFATVPELEAHLTEQTGQHADDVHLPL